MFLQPDHICDAKNRTSQSIKKNLVVVKKERQKFSTSTYFSLRKS